MTMPPGRYVGEAYLLEATDGERLPLQGGVYLVGSEGFGASSVEYETRQGYRQDGVSVVGYQLTQRDIDVRIRANAENARAAYWQLRQKMLNIVRPNRGSQAGELMLYIIQSDNTRYSIPVRYNGGLSLPLEQDVNDFAITATINFQAADPLWRGQTYSAVNAPETSSDDLIFPITFPISFGISGTRYALNIDYQGTWRTYPKLHLNGPYVTALLENHATGATIKMAVEISAGEERILQLEPNDLSVTDGNGNDKIDELTIDSNLIDFYIPPASELSGSQQQRIVGVFQGGSPAVDGLQITYTERYFGV